MVKFTNNITLRRRNDTSYWFVLCCATVRHNQHATGEYTNRTGHTPRNNGGGWVVYCIGFTTTVQGQRIHTAQVTANTQHQE